MRILPLPPPFFFFVIILRFYMSQKQSEGGSTAGTAAGSHSEERDNTILHLVQKILPSIQSKDEQLHHPLPTHYDALVSGVAVYRILHEIMPSIFSDVQAMEEVPDWLAVHRDAAAAPSTAETTGSPSSEAQTIMKGNLLTLIRHMNEHARSTLDAKRNEFNLTAMVNAGSIVQSTCLRSAAADWTETDRQRATEGREQFGVLTNLFVAMVALSGIPTMLHCLKQLPREEQKLLSDITREAMQTYGLKGSRPSVDTRRSVRPQSNRFSSPAMMGAGGGAGGSSVLPATSLPTAASSLLSDEGSYYLNKNIQLTQELEEVKSKAQEMEAKYALEVEERRSWEMRYKKLFSEMERQPTSDVSSLQQSLQQKSDTIDALNEKLDEQQARLNAIKQAASVHEMQNENTKRKIKQLEETITRMLSEYREMESKVALAEDKLAAKTKGYQELEVQVEQLRSEVRLLQLSKGNNGDGNDDRMADMSFASTGSVGRALILEKEVVEVRRQRDNLQKQVHVLQRQYAAASAMPSGGVASSVHSATQDTLKAQVRQLERERDAQKKQLQQAQERIQELEGQVGAAAAAAAAASVVGNGSIVEPPLPSEGSHAIPSPKEVGSGSALSEGVVGHNDQAKGEAAAEESARRDDNAVCEPCTPERPVGGDGGVELPGMATTEGAALQSAGGLSPEHLPDGGASTTTTTAALAAAVPAFVKQQQAIMSSLLLSYAYQNVVLQQHDVLLYKDKMEGYMERMRRGVAGGEEVEEYSTHNSRGGTLLSRQRRRIEEGLLESVVHNHIAKQ